MSSCLKSCGDCGSAYQEPGASRAGTRKSRAPSGVERVSVGVSTSTNPCASSTRRAAALTFAAQAQRCAGRGGAGPGSGTRSRASSPIVSSSAVDDLERQRRGLVEHDYIRSRHLDLAGGEVRVLVAARARRRPPGHLEHVLVAQPVRDRLVADDDLGDAARRPAGR